MKEVVLSWLIVLAVNLVSLTMGYRLPAVVNGLLAVAALHVIWWIEDKRKGKR